MRSRRNQPPAAEAISVSSIVLAERLLEERMRCGDDGNTADADR
jgi:hypothetical protein